MTVNEIGRSSGNVEAPDQQRSQGGKVRVDKYAGAHRQCSCDVVRKYLGRGYRTSLQRKAAWPGEETVLRLPVDLCPISVDFVRLTWKRPLDVEHELERSCQAPKVGSLAMLCCVHVQLCNVRNRSNLPKIVRTFFLKESQETFSFPPSAPSLLLTIAMPMTP